MIRGKKPPVVPVVSVSVYRKQKGAELTISVHPEHLNLKKYRKGPITIKWSLDTTGFKFSSDPDLPAIQFTSENWEKSFSHLTLHDHDRVATVRDKNCDGEAFSYNVNVVEVATGFTAVLDPIVQNNNS
jgi:hypothetical protein